MSCNNCLHVIKLLNLQQNNVITHQILLIKGVVEQSKCFKSQEIQLSIENAKVLTTGLSKETGRFKFLIDLGFENRNYELKFSYCQANITLNVVYQKQETKYKIQPLLILAKDEPQQSDSNQLNQKIIDLNLLLIQAVYADKLLEAVQQRLTFNFQAQCKIFISQLTQQEIWQLNEQDLWLQIAKELLTSPDWKDQDHIKFIAFINCSKYLGEEVEKSQDFSYQNIRKHIKGHAALGAGGLALFSCTYFYAWPHKFENILDCFSNPEKLNLSIHPDDSNYRKTKSGVYASSLGAVCHEIGHIFDLGHDLQGVMGSNFDYINRVFTLATKTEHLPERIVQPKDLTKPNKTRFTKLKDPANGFLQRYREQQENDSFYFSANSAQILSWHPWLRTDVEGFEGNTFEVEFKKDLNIIRSLLPLKLVELRENANSLVKEWFDLKKFLEEEDVYEFDLKSLKNKLLKDYYIFVMSIYGHTKKLEV